MKTKKNPKDPVNPVHKQTVKVAIPLLKDRVAPHFGVSSTFLLVETDGTTICGESMWDLPGEGPVEIARRLADLGVEKLICGGIQNQNKEWLRRNGVTVIDNQRGVAREIVRTHLGSPCDHVNLSPSMKEGQTDGHEKLC